MSGVFSLTVYGPDKKTVTAKRRQSNIITDMGRMNFITTGWQNIYVGLCPSTEPSQLSRLSLSTTPTACLFSANLGTGTITAGTNTRLFTTGNMGPAYPATMNVGTIFITTAAAVSATAGVPVILAYTVLDPVIYMGQFSSAVITYQLSINSIA
jgi:hypothetical protein